MAGVAATAPLLAGRAFADAKPVTLLNVSYDPTRELYKEINAAFASYWKGKTGVALDIKQSHGGSGKQARAVIDGLQADVVTLALAGDIDEIAARAKLLPPNWQSRLPNNSTPYTSTIVFLVRKGNPKGVRDWADLVKPGVGVITPNPKTSGGARWAYLAAYAYGLKLGGPGPAKDYIARLFKNVPVLGAGARDATTTFAQRNIGDVLLSWENEAFLTIDEFGPNFDIVYPSSSILAEPPVALLDKNVDRHNTRVVATGYLNFLYSPMAQDIIGKRHFRPREAKAAAKYAASFKTIPMVTIDQAFGGWKTATAVHFADGGLFDQVYKPT
ncbi:sulfate ABC transporter substrate-binding protein [Phenylobacterium sp.]|jgi:sulfate transport system substrate-binding protein|uniref:sulfate ABC transporter substrate-binding protein n=1 Tax=Phenylobacterium sp. TaxID=1871053 RepID=UPI002E31717E|nr:sulfate ABC transporter substrate-binding protein [Phenylobacterium sp.]HEX3364905.1 sulfate ABC transporter substrate-binding protein [Phenylobacterium sp.]